MISRATECAATLRSFTLFSCAVVSVPCSSRRPRDAMAACPRWRMPCNAVGMKPLLRLSVGVVVSLASSCADTSPRPSASPQPAPVVPPEETTIVLPHPDEARVVREMASARCDHEQACGNIGSRKKYATRDGCIEDTLPVVLREVTSNACPRGIDSDSATGCMAAIRQSACSNKFDRMASVDVCRTQAICTQ
jgi:hypothetical protein